MYKRDWMVPDFFSPELEGTNSQNINSIFYLTSWLLFKKLKHLQDNGSQNMLRQLDMAPYDHYRPQAGRDNDGSQIIWY